MHRSGSRAADVLVAPALLVAFLPSPCISFCRESSTFDCAPEAQCSKINSSEISLSMLTIQPRRSSLPLPYMIVQVAQ